MVRDESFHANISTYDSLLNHGTLLADFFEEWMERIFNPLDVKAYIEFEGPRLRYRFSKFSHKNWLKIRPFMEQNMITLFGIHNDNIDRAEKGLGRIEVYFGFHSNYEFPYEASIINFGVAKTLFDGEIPLEIQRMCVEMLGKLIQTVESSGAFITLDTIAKMFERTAHETYAGLSFSEATRELNRYYRGYHWGNFLSPNHVQLLGGPDRVKKDAPVFLVEELPDGGMHLQLTSDVNEVTDDELRKLMKFLVPILHPIVYKIDPEECNSMRVITDDDNDLILKENPLSTSVLVEDESNTNKSSISWELPVEITIPIDIPEELNPPNIQVVFFVNQKLNTEQEENIENAILAWYEVGIHGGYGGWPLHDLDRVIFDDEPTISMIIDMGQCPLESLDILYRVVINALGMQGIKVTKIALE